MLLGAVLGLLCLAYPPAGILVVVVAPWLFWQSRRRFVDAVRAAVPVGLATIVIAPATIHNWYASDGDLWPVIEDFLFGCEVDGYLEIDMHAGMDMRRLKAGYGDRITLYGNLDCGNTLSFGSPEEVRAHTIQCLEAGMGGGHILCASNAIAAGVSLENYLAVVYAYRDMFGLPGLEVR